MVALPAGDVAGDVVGVMGSGRLLAAPPGEPNWPENLAFAAVNWSHCPGTSSSQKIAPAGHAGATASALAGVDAEHPFALAEAADQAVTGAGLVLDAGARLCDHIRHGLLHLLR